jgi:hypothetical protein
MLVNLNYVTSMPDDLKNTAEFDPNEHWVGMPEYDPGGDEDSITLKIIFPDANFYQEFIDRTELTVQKRSSQLFAFYPEKERRDIQSVVYEYDDD